MNIDDVIAAKVEAAAARAEATKRRRATQQAARQAGLTARYRIKLARLDAAEASSVRDADGTPDALSTTEPTTEENQ